MRKTAGLAWLCAATVALVAGGCARNTAGGSAEGNYTIGYSQSTLEDPWRKAMNDELKAEEKNHANVKLLYQDAQNKAANQVQQVQALETQGIDALLISPIESGPLTPSVSALHKKGVPVILLDRGIDSEDYTALVGADNMLIGKEAGAFVVEKFPGGAKIIEIAGIPGATATKERAQGFREGTGDAAKDQIIASQPGDYLRGKAIQVFQTMLTANPEVDVVYAHNDEMALGAVQELKKAGRIPGVTVIGVDGQNEAIQSVADGEMAATFVYPRPADEGLKAALDVLAKKTVEKRIVLPTTRIDATNAKDNVGKGF